jgi:hypothetical protein
MTRAARATTILLAAAALFAAAVPAAQASPASLQQATSRCWLDVINDWIAHHPNLTGTYARPCYTQALQQLNSRPDIQGYSSAPDDIKRAMLAAIRDQRDGGGGSGPSGGSTPGGSNPGDGGGGSGAGSGGGGNAAGGSSGANQSGGGLGGVLGVHDATSVPLPLIVLGALAVLLALAALATWLARRFHERRPQPAPAVSRRR